MPPVSFALFALHLVALGSFAYAFSSRFVGGGVLTRATAVLVGMYAYLLLSFALPAAVQLLTPTTVVLTGASLALLMMRLSKRRWWHLGQSSSIVDAGSLVDVALAVLMACVWVWPVWRNLARKMYVGDLDVDVIAYHAPAMVEFIKAGGYAGDAPQVNAYFFGYESIVGSLAIFHHTALFFNLMFFPNLLLLALGNMLLIARLRVLFDVGGRWRLVALVSVLGFVPLVLAGAPYLATFITKNDTIGLALTVVGVATLCVRRDARIDRGSLILGATALGVAGCIKPTFAMLGVLTALVSVFWIPSAASLSLTYRIQRFVVVVTPLFALCLIWVVRNKLNEGVLFTEALWIEGSRKVLSTCYEMALATASSWHRYFRFHIAFVLLLGFALLAATVASVRWRVPATRPAVVAWQRLVLMAAVAALVSLQTPFAVYHVEPPRKPFAFCEYQLRLVNFHFELIALAVVASVMGLAKWFRSNSVCAESRPPSSGRLTSAFLALALIATLAAGSLWARHWEQNIRYSDDSVITDWRDQEGRRNERKAYKYVMDKLAPSRILVGNIGPYPLYGRHWRHDVVNRWFHIKDVSADIPMLNDVIVSNRIQFLVVATWPGEWHVPSRNPPAESFTAWALGLGMKPVMISKNLAMLSVPESLWAAPKKDATKGAPSR